jgi:hypothetical protein
LATGANDSYHAAERLDRRRIKGSTRSQSSHVTRTTTYFAADDVYLCLSGEQRGCPLIQPSGGVDEIG